MPAQRLSALLAGGTLAPLSDASRRRRELQRVFFDSVPPPLARATRVKALLAGTLCLATANAAVAAKLRQLAPRLLTAIRKRVPEVNGIRVEVQVSTPADEPRRNLRKTPLTVETIENLEKLAGAVRDSGLKSAVRALARRHRR